MSFGQEGVKGQGDWLDLASYLFHIRVCVCVFGGGSGNESLEEEKQGCVPRWRIQKELGAVSHGTPF